jgi:Flp pilus assembly protein TadD
MLSRLAIVSLLLASAFPVFGQRVRPSPNPRSISGQVRMDQKPAPQGVLVLLDVAPQSNVAVTGSGSAAQTMTDSSGKFFFDHLEQVGTKHGQEYFAVTVRYPGYRDAVQVVDLSSSPRGYALLEIGRDTSRDTPNVPPEGAGATISARQPASAEAQKTLAQGQQLLLEKHDPRASIDDFKKVVKLDPQYGPGYVLLGTAYMQTQEWSDARAAFEQAAKIDPKNAAASLGIGAALNQLKDYPGAQKALLQSLQLKPDSAEAEYELARSLYAQSKWEDAEPHVHKSIALNKDYASPHLLMGNIYLRRRDANAALAEYQEYLRLAPEGPQASAAKEIVDRIQRALGQK